MIKYANPAAIKGPTATPLKKNIPAIVPITSDEIISGLFCRAITPRPAAAAVNIPANIVIIPSFVLNDSKKILISTEPSNNLTNIAAVSIVTK